MKSTDKPTSSHEKRTSQFAYDLVDDALAALCEHIKPVGVEQLPVGESAGRVLAEKILLDRPSPACSVSAMDGYAMRMAQAKPGKVIVAGEVQAGQATCELPAGQAVRIFTGAMVPEAAELVIQREHVQEQSSGQTSAAGDAITLPADLKVKQGQHIRFAGENGQPGDVICEPGRLITSPMLGAMSSVGMTHVSVYKPLRVGILITGGEVLDAQASPEPWQIRDSNGPGLLGLLGTQRWLLPMKPRHVHDEPEAIRAAIGELLATCDALLLTGGVSAGDYDFVPRVLGEMGAKIVFHKLPIRPGKPVLGAVSAQGCPIFGLPGNPVSVMVTAQRLAMHALRNRAGLTTLAEPSLQVDVVDTLVAPAKLTWFPLVKFSPDGQAHAVGGKGSGDWVSAGASDGFVEVPPGEAMNGRRQFYAWPGS